MNKAQETIQAINEISLMKKPRFREGDKVRFGGGSIHGKYTGTIKRLFGNNKASVSAKVRGRDKIFHPDFDDMTLVTEVLCGENLLWPDEDLDERGEVVGFSVGDIVKVDLKHPSIKREAAMAAPWLRLLKAEIKDSGDGKLTVISTMSAGTWVQVSSSKTRGMILGPIGVPWQALTKVKK